MRFRVDLKNERDITRIESLAPDGFDRLTLQTASGHFTRLGGETDFRRACVAGDELNRQLERRDQEFGGIVRRVARRHATQLHRRLGVAEAIERCDAAGFIERASNIVLGRDADIFKLARIEFDAGIADHLVDNLVAVKVDDGESVWLGDLVNVVGGDETGGPWHVLDDNRRISGNVSTQMTGDQARIAIKAAAGGKADDKLDRFALVERRGGTS